MKVIRKIFQIIFTIILISLMGVLALSCNFKTILVDGVIKEVIKERITVRDYEEENLVVTEDMVHDVQSNEIVQEILNDPEVQDLMNQYLDQTIDGLIDGEVDDIQFEQDLVNYIRNNKEKISSIVGEEITDEMIDQALEEIDTQEMSRVIKQSIQNASANLTETERVVLKGYKVFTSKSFQILLGVLILFNIIIIALLQWSLHAWIKTTGISLSISGFGVMLLSSGVDLIVKMAINGSSFQTKSLFITGTVMLISGIVIIILYSVIRKRIKKGKEKKNEVS